MGLFKELEEKLEAVINDRVAALSLQSQGERLYDNFAAMFKEFEEYYASLHSIRDDTPITASDSMASNETASDREGSVKAKPRTTKSTSSSGSKNVSSLADLLNIDT
jgi:hypothetical protein